MGKNPDLPKFVKYKFYDKSEISDSNIRISCYFSITKFTIITIIVFNKSYYSIFIIQKNYNIVRKLIIIYFYFNIIYHITNVHIMRTDGQFYWFFMSYYQY